MSILAWLVVGVVIFLVVSDTTRNGLKRASIVVANGTKLPNVPANIPWKFILLGGVLILSMIFWDSIKVGIAEWFVDSDANQQLKVEKDTITSWFWLIVPIFIGAGYYIWRFVTSDKKQVKPFASSGVGGFIESIVGSTGMVAIFGVLVISVLAAIAMVLAFANEQTDGGVQQIVDKGRAIARGEPLPTRDQARDECDFKETLDARNGRLSTQWIAITLCESDNQFLVFVPEGTKPEIEFRDRDDRVLNSRAVSDFVRVEYMLGKPGGMKNLYRLFVPQHYNGFKDTSYDAVAFDIRAASTTAESMSFTPEAHTVTPREPELTDVTDTSECTGVFKDLTGCTRIVFGRNEKFDHRPPKGYCSAGNGLITGTSLNDGNTVTRWTGNADNVVGHVFAVKLGESFQDFTCGK